MNKFRFKGLILLLFLLLAISCGKDEVLSDTVMLNLELYDNNNQIVSGAKVYLFNDQTKLHESVEKLQAIGAIDSTLSSDGQAQISITAQEKYYIWIYYKDVVKKLTLFNDRYNSPIDSIPKGFNITIRVKLNPIDGHIAFWTTSANALPISINLAGDTFTLNKSAVSGPASVNDDGMIISKKTGIYKYYAKNANGCVWAGNITLLKGQFISKELTGCGTGEVAFWTDATNQAHLPITVVVNDVDTLGTLPGVATGYQCGDTDKSKVLSVFKESGNFTYVASSADNKCVWTGTFTMTQGVCQVIQLKTCK